jgi:hypothetical protein
MDTVFLFVTLGFLAVIGVLIVAYPFGDIKAPRRVGPGDTALYRDELVKVFSVDEETVSFMRFGNAQLGTANIDDLELCYTWTYGD